MCAASSSCPILTIVIHGNLLYMPSTFFERGALEEREREPIMRPAVLYGGGISISSICVRFIGFTVSSMHFSALFKLHLLSSLHFCHFEALCASEI